MYEILVTEKFIKMLKKVPSKFLVILISQIISIEEV